MTLPSCLGALLGAQEHRRETLICDVFLVKLDDVKYERTPKGCGECSDQRALFETFRSCLGALLGAQEHRRVTLICDVGFVLTPCRCLPV